MDARPASVAGRDSTLTPSRSRPNAVINGGRTNVASNLLAEDDDEDIDSILSPNVRVEPIGKIIFKLVNFDHRCFHGSLFTGRGVSTVDAEDEEEEEDEDPEYDDYDDSPASRSKRHKTVSKNSKNSKHSTSFKHSKNSKPLRIKLKSKHSSA